MIITKPTYVYRGISPETSTMRVKHQVLNTNECEIILVTNYDVVSEGFYETFKELVNLSINEGKEIYYDSTTELLSQEFLEKVKSYKNLSTLKIFTNGVIDESKINSKVVKLRGATIIVEPFFVKYYDYYQPIKDVDIIRSKVKKSFLLLGGKSKTFRTALTALLYFEGLDDYGYISYFGFNPLGTFTNETKDMYFMTDSPNEQKRRVQIGLEKMGSNKVLDVTSFNHKISHTREYDATYYDMVDFVIIMESDVTNDRSFITEKTTKCVQQNKKFILLSSKGMLDRTKKEYLNYHNKDISHLTDWCDTLYDNIEDVWLRIDKIVKIIKNEIIH